MKEIEQIVSLSHWINEDTPVYGNKGGFIRRKLSSIQNGDTANSEYWEFNNHIGTHIDFPKHFCKNGKRSSDYSASYFCMKNAAVIELDMIPDPGQIIGVNDIKNACSLLDWNLEVLLLKTGFENFRTTDIYWSQNPGYNPELYGYLRTMFPLLRFFGFDTISLTSILNRELGKSAHKEFLCNEAPILVVEDMHLQYINSTIIPFETMIIPLPIEQADGVPVACYFKYMQNEPSRIL